MNIDLAQVAIVGCGVALVVGLMAIPIAVFRGDSRRTAHLSLGCLAILATLVVASGLVWAATSGTVSGH